MHGTSGSSPTARHIRVLMRPSRGTNRRAPIYALVDSLPDDVEVVKFSWKRALVGSWDILHLHWPESLLRASGRAKKWAKYALFLGLLARVAVSKPAVWTVHNESPHERGARVEAFLLGLWGRVTRRNIYLYPSVTPTDERSVFIPFGDYSHLADELLTTHSREREARRILLFGLLRPYKGIEQLVEAYATLVAREPATSLAIMGRPIDEGYGREVENQVRGVPHLDFRGELIEYEELVGEITRSSFVVLPYRRMYNSGAALLALSCGTPILVPTSQTMEDLRAESGEEWVMTYDGDLTADILDAALARFSTTASERESRSALPLRSWSEVGEQYAELYRSLVAERRR
ncbi:glycosyltransferase [Microbacterium sp. NPDC016588]